MGIELTEDERKDFKTSITKLSKAAEFSNVVFRREYIRDLPNQEGGTTPHVMYWLVNASYLPRFEAAISKLKKRYSGRIVGRMLDYLHPKYRCQRSHAVAVWTVSVKGFTKPVEAFREGLFHIDPKELQEKLSRLREATPSGAEVNLDVIPVERKQNIADSIITRTMSSATQHRFSSLISR